MHHSLPVDVLLVAGLALLLLSGLHDFAFRTLPNWVSLALFCTGVALRLIEGGGLGLAIGLGIAAVILLLTYICWNFGLMGGGDVKLLTAAAIFVTPWMVPFLISGTAIAGGVLSALYLFGSFVVRRPRGERPAGFVRRVLRCEQWRFSRRGPVPYAVAIAAGGWIATLHA